MKLSDVAAGRAPTPSRKQTKLDPVTVRHLADVLEGVLALRDRSKGKCHRCEDKVGRDFLARMKRWLSAAENRGGARER